MNIAEVLAAFAGTVAADVKRVETAVIGVANGADAKLNSFGSALRSLTDEVHSIIDDQSQASNANTWSIDQIKAFIDSRIAALEDSLKASMVASVAGQPNIDLVATYLNAKQAATPASAPAQQ